VPLGEMRGHQPDEVAGAKPTHPRIGGEPPGYEQCQHPEQVGQEQADPNGLLLLRFGKFVGESRDAENVITERPERNSCNSSLSYAESAGIDSLRQAFHCPT
jgi:hypothetical protein